jgi:hypothetical protein
MGNDYGKRHARRSGMRWHLVDANEIPGLLRQAVARVAAQHNCTLQEADEWIQQEARTKKASLGEVAAAILAGRTADYRYDVPL